MRQTRLLLLLLTITLVLILGFVSLKIYPTVAPRRLEVVNRTDGQLQVQVGTSYHLQVAPHSVASLKTGWVPFNGWVEVGDKQCDFKKVSKQPLIVDDDGVHCQDVHDEQPFPTPKPE